MEKTNELNFDLVLVGAASELTLGPKGGRIEIDTPCGSVRSLG